MPEGESVAIVRAFMAHHQGMTIVAIADALLDGAMRARFHAEPIVKATELLLQERMPRDVAVVRPWAAEVKSAANARDIEPSGGRRFTSAHQATPATHLLSNGRFTTMLTSAGSGYSRWGDMALTRWREDATCDDFGSYIFLRDVRSGVAWSAGFQPSGVEPDETVVVFNEDRAEITRRDGSLTTTLDVLVSAEDDAEVRRVSITNSGARSREIEITSYAELVLAPQNADVAHPAFSKLFVETEYLVDVGAILATRRRRAPSEPEIWAAHLSVVDGEAVGAPEFETDRARFLGRGHNVRTPIAMMDSRPLSNTVGAVLDPIFSIRRRIRVAPGATVRVAFWTIVASSREAMLDVVDKHRDGTAFTRASTLAWTQAQVQLHHLGVTAGEASLFQRLAGHVIYASPGLRPTSETIARGAGAQSGLWSQGVSGDVPIVLLRIADIENLDIVRELLQAHEYWRMKQLAVDLVILNERQSSYVQELQIAIETLVRASQSRPRSAPERQPGGVFVLRADLISAETRALLTSVARVVLPAQRGRLFEQLERIVEPVARVRGGVKRAVARLEPPSRPRPPALEFFNGLGGFARDGKEYVTVLGPGQSTPAPWINVIANPAFGFQTGTEGGGYTWSLNSRENQLTPWSNDPVSDRLGEAIFLRDDETGDLWSPTAQPIRDPTATYIARHGRGYSRFEHVAHEIAASTRAVCAARRFDQDFASHADQSFEPHPPARRDGLCRMGSRPVALPNACLSYRPSSTRSPERSSPAILGAWASDPASPSPISVERRPIGPAIGASSSAETGRSPIPPRSPTRAPFSKKVGAGLDPCAAMRTRIEVPPNGSVEIVFLLGEAASATRRANSLHAIAPPISTRSRLKSSASGRRGWARSSSRRRIARWTSC